MRHKAIPISVFLLTFVISLFTLIPGSNTGVSRAQGSCNLAPNYTGDPNRFCYGTTLPEANINKLANDYATIYLDASVPGRGSIAAQNLRDKLNSDLNLGCQVCDDRQKANVPLFKQWIIGTAVTHIFATAVKLKLMNIPVPSDLDSKLDEVKRIYSEITPDIALDKGCGLQSLPYVNSCMEDYALTASGFAWIAAYEKYRVGGDPYAYALKAQLGVNKAFVPMVNGGGSTCYFYKKYNANLRAINGQYVVAEQGGGDVVNANRDAAGPWETFALLDINGGDLVNGDRINLRTYGGYYLQATNGGGSSLTGLGTTPTSWETFVVNKVSGSAGAEIRNGDTISLMVANGNYVVAEQGGGGVVNANRTAVGAWEGFTLVLNTIVGCDGNPNETDRNKVRIIGVDHNQENPSYGLGVITGVASACKALELAGYPYYFSSNEKYVALQLFKHGQEKSSSSGGAFNSNDCVDFINPSGPKVNCKDDSILGSSALPNMKGYLPTDFPLKRFFDKKGLSPIDLSYFTFDRYYEPRYSPTEPFWGTNRYVFYEILAHRLWSYEGNHDGADCNTIFGWAWDRSRPEIRVNVEIYDGSNLLAVVPANQFRQDLVNAGIGDGYYGFYYSTPASLKNGQSHSIRIKIQDIDSGQRVDLYNSPKTILCASSCSYSISPTSQTIAGSGGSGTVNVTTGATCNWAASSNASWISITAGSSGSGSGTVSYLVAANNTGSSRSGTLTIADKTFTVSQSAQSCTTPIATAPSSFPNDVVWVDDQFPAGAQVTTNWVWDTAQKASGTQSNTEAIDPGIHQHYFHSATNTLAIGAGEKLVCYVLIDPCNPPQEVMLQWNDGSWEHRAFWGADLISWGTPGTTSRLAMGPLPVAGQWVRLEVPASSVGLEGSSLNGMAFTLYGGKTWFDRAGKSGPVTSQSNNSSFISQSVPTTMNAGQSYNVSVTVQNTGTTTWSPYVGYPSRLGSENPRDNTIWGISRVELPAIVSPGQLVTFNFTVRAPSTAGTYNFQWRMLQEVVEWFGDFTPNVAINVLSDTSTNNAAFVSESVPTSMLAGTSYNVSVTMKNTGTTTWTSTQFYKLASENPPDNFTWSLNRVNLPATVQPGQQVTFNFTVVAPSTPGTYGFRWRMTKSSVHFGSYSQNVFVSVN
jgi:hypothetical protein